MTPRELLDQALRHLLAKDMAAFADLWAVDGVLEFPFAPPGYPTRLEGRAQVREYLRDYPKFFDVRGYPEMAVHETVDPDVIVVEFAIDGVMVRTGEPYLQRYIAVITVRDDQIHRYRDYWTPPPTGDVEAFVSAGSGDGDA